MDVPGWVVCGFAFLWGAFFVWHLIKTQNVGDALVALAEHTRTLKRDTEEFPPLPHGFSWDVSLGENDTVWVCVKKGKSLIDSRMPAEPTETGVRICAWDILEEIKTKYCNRINARNLTRRIVY